MKLNLEYGKSSKHYSSLFNKGLARHKEAMAKIQSGLVSEEDVIDDLITRSDGAVLDIHEDETFTQCYIPLNREKPDKKKIRSQLRKRYFISEKYCRLLEVCENESKRTFYIKWVPEDTSRADGRPKFMVMQDKTKMLDENGKVLKDENGKTVFDTSHIFKNGITTTALYGLVFGCSMTPEAEKIVKKNVYQAFGATENEENEDNDKRVQAHHLIPYQTTTEKKNHIYDVNIIKIMTLKEHNLFDKKIESIEKKSRAEQEKYLKEYKDKIEQTIDAEDTTATASFVKLTIGKDGYKDLEILDIDTMEIFKGIVIVGFVNPYPEGFETFFEKELMSAYEYGVHNLTSGGIGYLPILDKDNNIENVIYALKI